MLHVTWFESSKVVETTDVSEEFKPIFLLCQLKSIRIVTK